MFNRFNKMVNRMIKSFNYYNCKRSFDENLDIRIEDLENYIKMGATIVDVRSPQEYKEGHIDGAISIPDYQIKKQIEKQIQNKDELIVIYCTTGQRSQRAQQILENMGYNNVYNVYNGVII